MICHDLIENTKGFLDRKEGMRLYEIALEAGKKGPCLEIGSYCGKSALYLGAACKKNNQILFSIDHHRGSEEHQKGEEYFDPELFDHDENKVDSFKIFRKTIEAAGLCNTVVPIVAKSHIAAKAWKTPLALVFIDGGHALETVRLDYDSWAKHIIPGGYLCIHDIFKNPEEGGQAPYLIYSHALKSGIFAKEPMTKTLGVLKRA